MSRIGKLPIKIPQGTRVSINGQDVSVKGPKGELKRKITPEIFLEMKGDVLHVRRKDDSRRTRALHGLTRALLANMVEGVTNGFKKELVVTGVGYKVESKEAGLVLHIGYSHPIEFDLPHGISARVERQKDIRILLEGYDKEAVGLAASRIRSFRPPEPYKGKGIRYADEVIIRKAGKAAAK